MRGIIGKGHNLVDVFVLDSVLDLGYLSQKVFKNESIFIIM